MIHTTPVCATWCSLLNDEFVSGLVPAHLPSTIAFSLVYARLVCRCCALDGAIFENLYFTR